MNENISADLHLGKELANYAKSQGANGIMHTDEDISTYQLDDEFAAVCDQLGKEDGDVVVILAEHEDNAWNAAELVAERADKLPHTIPEETRTAEMDHTTKYARPLPGSARMYPETDIPPITIADTYLDEINADLPETLEEQEEHLAGVIGEELAAQVVHSKQLQTFNTVLDQLAQDDDRDDVLEAVGKPLANTVTNIRAQLESDDVPVDRVQTAHYVAIFAAYRADTISKSDIADVLQAVAEQPDADVNELINETVAQKAGEDEIRAVVQDVIAEKEDMIAEQGEHARGALMGLVMQQLENADGSTVNKVLSEELQKKL
jgi:glutamyl-tRNA(Gln) amidotransferase subunit E